MAAIKIDIDLKGFERLARLLAAAGQRVEPAVAQAINQVGDAGKQALARTLPDQTGLQRKTIVKFLRATSRAGPGRLVFSIKGRGGDISLRYFGAREEGSGVSAAPWGHRRLFVGAFMTSGRAPNRVYIARLNGQVYQRVSGNRWNDQRAGRKRPFISHIRKVKSGLYLPHEMVTGEAGEAWTKAVQSGLPAAIDKAVSKAFQT